MKKLNLELQGLEKLQDGKYGTNHIGFLEKNGENLVFTMFSQFQPIKTVEVVLHKNIIISSIRRSVGTRTLYKESKLDLNNFNLEKHISEILDYTKSKVS